MYHEPGDMLWWHPASLCVCFWWSMSGLHRITVHCPARVIHFNQSNFTRRYLESVKGPWSLVSSLFLVFLSLPKMYFACFTPDHRSFRALCSAQLCLLSVMLLCHLLSTFLYLKKWWDEHCILMQHCRASTLSGLLSRSLSTFNALLTLRVHSISSLSWLPCLSIPQATFLYMFAVNIISITYRLLCFIP